MKLWIGGACQGKSRLALEDTAEQLGGRMPVVADGNTDGIDMAQRADVVLHMHSYIRRIAAEGGDHMAFVDAVIAAKPVAVVMDEVGYGIVPVLAEERKFREAAGHAGQRLAKAAAEVYRVMCGIAVPIKEPEES